MFLKPVLRQVAMITLIAFPKEAQSSTGDFIYRTISASCRISALIIDAITIPASSYIHLPTLIMKCIMNINQSRRLGQARRLDE